MARLANAGILFIVLLMSFGVARSQGRPDKNILSEYFRREVFAKNGSGLFMMETERILADSLYQEFDNSSSLIVIKEYCDPYNLSGCVYSPAANQITYFSRIGNNNIVVLNKPSYEMATIFYQRIIGLVQADSLRYYKIKNDKLLNADDENCWLYVIKIDRSHGKYQEKKTTFYHPLGLRKSIINEKVLSAVAD